MQSLKLLALCSYGVGNLYHGDVVKSAPLPCNNAIFHVCVLFSVVYFESIFLLGVLFICLSVLSSSISRWILGYVAVCVKVLEMSCLVCLYY